MYEIIMSQRAQSHLERIFRYIAKASSPRIAEGYVEAIRAECQTLSTLPMRGTDRGAKYRGLRTMGFRHSATIAFRVSRNNVTIVAVFYRGLNVSDRL